MTTTANKIVKQAQSWLGWSEANGKAYRIIDVYNAHSPLAMGYKVKRTDAWCATFVSACAIKCGATDIIPTECSCPRFIELCKKKGIWRENENMTPRKGDIVLYDWDDDGYGDNRGTADHIGIVESVNEAAETFTVIEGNFGEAVKRRTLAFNARYLRGFARPKYQAEAAAAEPTAKPAASGGAKADPAASFQSGLARSYKTTTALNLRKGAGKKPANAVLAVMPKGAKVRCHGYYTAVNGTKWLLVEYVNAKGKTLTGFCSKRFLK